MPARSVVTGLATAALLGCGTGDDRGVDARLALSDALAAPVDGFAKATEPRPFVFPADHGPHPEFATEWWYFTGNVFAADGRRFGYELTFFRKALALEPLQRASALAADQAYMAHLAVTDVQSNELHAFDRFGRAAAGLAGAQAAPFRVWLYDWSVEAETVDPFPARIRAAEGDVVIDLVIERGKPPVVNGEDGLSRKGGEPGNASYYYSLTRIPTRGTIRIGSDSAHVTGTSWMDREWSSSALADDLDGWDWFALQLSDGTELMVYRLRRSDGTASPFSAGTVVSADGSARSLVADDVALEVVRTWRSPLDDTEYPAGWRLLVPAERLELEIVPVVADQELNLAVRYWEGAVDVRGERAGDDVRGVGYVELTGYSPRNAASGSARDALRAGR